MHRWERRLKDLSIALENCTKNYFEPDLFRFNSNHFLTTARTVSFLFQKDKASIINFTDWHKKNIVEAWQNDEIMKWSISARNSIEKEGDLDLHSQIQAILIFSYIEDQDIKLTLDRIEHLNIGVKRLIRFARQKLPSGVSDVAVVKIERSWIANTLPHHELLQAFRYIYARMYEACSSLSVHLESTLESSIPEATSFDDLLTGNKRAQYLKLNSTKIGNLVTRRYKRDETFKPAEWIYELAKEKALNPPTNLIESVNFHAKMAEANFNQFGNHMAMVWLLNDRFEPIDYIATIPEDQAYKFIFWRTIADRIHYLKAKSLIWVSEAWLRSGVDKNMTKIIRNLPITGEVLSVVGVDGKSNYHTIVWEIERANESPNPTLKLLDESDNKHLNPKEAYYLIPAKRALEAVALTAT